MNMKKTEVDKAIRTVKAYTRYSIRYFLTYSAARDWNGDKTDIFNRKLDTLIRGRNQIIETLKHAKKTND